MSIKEEQKNNQDNYNEKWIIDTDPGVDDSFAIILAITFLKENILALSIANGNVGIDGCYKNAKKICAIKDFHIPIYKGVYNNISGLKFEASDFHGKDGLLEISEFDGYENRYNEEKILFQNFKNLRNNIIEKYSPLKIIELSYEFPKMLNILACAPLTNLAVALMLDPSLPERINKIIIMGGSYSSLGNIKSNTEFNFACDPIAAKKVFSSFNKYHNEISLYPWESCLQHLINRDHLDLLGTSKFFEYHNKINYYNDKIDNENLESERNCKGNDTRRYIEKIILKKEFFPESGIFADFGSAVYMINKKSLTKSKKSYVDISIDSGINNFGQLIMESNYIMNKNFGSKDIKDNNADDHHRKKVEIIMSLDKDIYYDSFIKMSEN
jgi:inosine-uridine nucleoside N-ribohydrolase